MTARAIVRVDFLATDDTEMLAVFIPAGLTPSAGDRRPSTEDRIQFFDTRHPFTPDGQFVAEYHVGTLAPAGEVTSGLRLPSPWGGIDVPTMRNLIRDFYPY